MQLRLLVLVGWKKTDESMEPELMYFGNDGTELQAKADEAAKAGNYVVIRKFVNPSGIPCPVTVDPAPKATVFYKPEVKAPVEQQKKTPAQLKAEQDAKDQKQREQTAVETDATNLAIIREGRAFADLSKNTKGQLTEILSDLNSDLPEDKRIPAKPGASKVDLINSILVAQGIKKPAPTTETKTENETH